MSMNQSGNLYIVATPIGNKADISPRAIETLQAVDLVAVEDRRHSSKLFKLLDISAPMLAYHDHNEDVVLDKLLGKLREGQDIALVSDAGTPLISDPGYRLVKKAREEDIPVIPIPGPCALVAALSVSGLPSDRFVFEGFLPAKSGARRQHLEALKDEPRTLIFYESPHRLLKTLADMQSVFGEQRFAVIARELTKLYETVLQGALAELMEVITDDDNQQRGEFVLLVQGADVAAGQLDTTAMHTLEVLLKEMPLKKAVALAAKITGVRKNELYQRALEASASSPD
jgi:16S rRNA (cytidine1402-2'-O)-methyltransferase